MAWACQKSLVTTSGIMLMLIYHRINSLGAGAHYIKNARFSVHSYRTLASLIRLLQCRRAGTHQADSQPLYFVGLRQSSKLVWCVPHVAFGRVNVRACWPNSVCRITIRPSAEETNSATNQSASVYTTFFLSFSSQTNGKG